MAKSKKASRRLVQPRPEHYKQRTREDGEVEDLLCGPYSLKQRKHWFETVVSMYMTRHPKATHTAAHRAALVRWRNVVFATIGDEYVPVKDPKKAKDTVPIFDHPVHSKVFDEIEAKEKEQKDG